MHSGKLIPSSLEPESDIIYPLRACERTGSEKFDQMSSKQACVMEEES